MAMLLLLLLARDGELVVLQMRWPQRVGPSRRKRMLLYLCRMITDSGARGERKGPGLDLSLKRHDGRGAAVADITRRVRHSHHPIGGGPSLERPSGANWGVEGAGGPGNALVRLGRGVDGPADEGSGMWSAEEGRLRGVRGGGWRRGGDGIRGSGGRGCRHSMGGENLGLSALLF